VRVFDLATQQQVAMLSGHTDRVLSVDFLRSGTGIATACKDGKTRIFPWPPEDATGVVEPLVTITARSGYPSQVASSMHGHSIYVGNDNGLIIKYNTKTGLEESQVQVDQPLWKITPCQDDSHLLTTARWSVRRLDMERLEAPPAGKSAQQCTAGAEQRHCNGCGDGHRYPRPNLECRPGLEYNLGPQRCFHEARHLPPA